MGNKKKEKTKWLKSSFIKTFAFLLPSIRAVLWRRSPGILQIRKTLTSTSANSSADESNNFRHQACTQRLLITESGAIKPDLYRNLFTKFLFTCINLQLHVGRNFDLFSQNTNSNQFYSHEPQIPETYQQAEDSISDYSEVLHFSLLASFVESVHLERSPPNQIYADFFSRLFTFKLWPSASLKEVLELAVSGFYYTGVGDIVECFHCHGQLQNWKPGENPFIRHLRSFRTCGFVRQEKDLFKPALLCTSSTIFGVNNVELGNNHSQPLSQSEVNNETHLSADSSHAAVAFSGESPDNTLSQDRGTFLHIYGSENVGPDGRITWTEEQLRDLGFIPRQLPFKLQYSDYQQRLLSFLDVFVMSAHLTHLARAGFFYAGYSDAILCFYCGGGLRSLFCGIDIYKAHARHYPGCGYIRFLLSTELVNSLYASDPAGASLQGHYTYYHQEEDLEQTSSETLCRKCRLRQASVLFFPCCHLLLCTDCGISVMVCFLCRSQLSHFKRVSRSTRL